MFTYSPQHLFNEPEAGSLTVAAPETPAYTPPAPQGTLSQDELNQFRNQIDTYNASPEISGAVAELVVAHQHNPEHLATLVRELTQAIDAVKANPHLVQPLNPEIAAVVRQVQEEEQKKPDPLNVFRAQEEGQQSLAQTTQALFAAPVAALTGSITPHDAPQSPASPAFSNAGGNIGTSVGAFLEFVENTGPTRVPDVRNAGGPAQGFSLA